MKNDIYSFKADLKKLSRALDADLGKLIRVISLDLFNMIILRSPVDTGFSRSQWKVSIGEPDPTVVEPPKGKQAGTITAPTADPDVIAQIQKDSTVFITNAVDYIQYLEEGSSKQAPAGMIRVSLAESEAKVDQYLSSVIEP